MSSFRICAHKDASCSFVDDKHIVFRVWLNSGYKCDRLSVTGTMEGLTIQEEVWGLLHGSLLKAW